MRTLKIHGILRNLREEAGLKQESIAADLHISRQSICNYENGLRTPNLAMACKLADELKVSLDMICCGEEYTGQKREPYSNLPRNELDLLETYQLLDDTRKNAVESYVDFLLFGFDYLPDQELARRKMLARTITYKRRLKGLSRAQLACRANVSLACIMQLENPQGEPDCGLDKLMKIAEILQMPKDFFLETEQ